MRSRILSLRDPAEAERFHAAGLWGEHSSYELFRAWAWRAPDRVAVVERDRTFTYSEVLDAVDRVATDLRGRGLTSGERVAAWLPSRAETVVLFLACSRERFVFTPSFHRDHTAADVASLCERAAVRLVVVQDGYGADSARTTLAEQVSALDHPPVVVSLAPAAARPDGPLFPDCSPPARPAPAADAGSVVYLAFTSGTTGRPKGVMHSDYTLLAPAEAMARDWSLSDSSVIYSLSPLSHNLGFGAMVMSLAIGATLVVHDLERGASLVDRLEQLRVSFVFGVPTHAIDLLGELRATGRTLPDVQGFRVSGAALPSSVAEGLVAAGIRPQVGFGMTEAGSHHYSRPDDPVEVLLNTAGRPFEGHEVRILDPDDAARELPVGEVGQIASRGPSVMLGYFDDQRLTEEAFTSDGWFLTGDLGAVDEQGYLRIAGRQKDIIVRGGHNIAPGRIEDLALRHPSVRSAAAVAIADPRLGERVGLVLVTSEVLDSDDVLRHLANEGLSKYDMPEYLATIDAMPLTPSGKVLKRQVVAEIERAKIQLTPVKYVEAS